MAKNLLIWCGMTHLTNTSVCLSVIRYYCCSSGFWNIYYIYIFYQSALSRSVEHFQSVGAALSVSFHIGAFCFDARQFGAFHFGDFHFDAVPVRRVSLWRASTSARFSLARFHFGAFLFGALPLRRVSLWRVSQFCTNLRWSGICERQFRADCFLSANKCFLRQFGAYLFLRSVSICAHVSYLRRSVFYAGLTRFSFCAYVDRICEYGIVFSGFFYARISFCVFFLWLPYV